MTPFICFLHGTFGSGSQWSPIVQALGLSEKDYFAPNLYSEGILSPSKPLEFWCQGLNAELNDRAGGRPVIVVGYSLGGRLGCYFLNQHRGSMKVCGIIVSANPLQFNEVDLSSRKVWEQDWSRKVTNQSWSKFMIQWNEQEIFAGQAHPLAILESEFDKNLIAQGFLTWSNEWTGLSNEEVKTVDSQCDWVIGERDQKYRKIFENLKAEDMVQNVFIAPQCGHRVPWDQPEFLVKIIKGKILK